MRILTWLAVVAAFLTFAPMAQAEPTALTPALQLVAHNLRDDRGKDIDGALTISSLDVTVDIAGRMAQSTLVVTFANPTENRLEGDFTLNLPTGASVTAYGLDINGVMTDGVLERNLKAEEAYEDTIRKGIDPGLGQVTAGNQFRTHIFPILPGSGRTVRIVYTTPLGTDGRFVMPLTTGVAVQKLTVAVATHGLTGAPMVTLGDFHGTSQGERLGFEVRDKAVDGDLVLTGIMPTQPITVSRHSNGERFFELTVGAEPAGKIKVNGLRVYWDASRSRRDEDVMSDGYAMAAYLDATKPESVDLIVFGDGVSSIRHFDHPTTMDILNALKDTTYSGATRYTGLNKAVPGRADVCLVFSDGHATIGSFSAERWPCRVMTVSSSPLARRDILRQLAARNAGAYVDLLTVSREDMMRLLTMRAPKLWDLTDGDGNSLDYQMSPLGSDQYRIIGPAPRDGHLSLDYGGESHDYDLSKVASTDQDGVGVAWGAGLIDALNATDAPDADKILATARRYRVATPDVSFIVLESGADYARADIAPPATASKDILSDYQAERDRMAAVKAEARTQRLDNVTAMWNDQKTWWAAPSLSLAEAKKRLRNDPKRNRGNGDMALMAEMAPPPPAVMPTLDMASPVMAEPMSEPSPAPSGGLQGGYTAGDADSEMVLVTAVRRAPRNTSEPQATAPPPIEVETAEWNPDRPYLKALSDVKPGDKDAFASVFAAQEKTNGDNPAFYFDTAEWMFRNGFADGAAAMARTALDLPASNIDSQIILAGRLLRYGEGDDALWLYRHIAALTPDKPQAKRNLALALIAVTDARLKTHAVSEDAAVDAYEEALSLLSEVVLTPWDGAYDGIEIIALTEANHLVVRLKAMNVPAEDLAEVLPAQLTALLDVDIRITLEWNTDDTDMDLWVDEPSGERAIYSNPSTLLGGRLSNDMTEGYGPEEYMLRFAPNGDYKVLANVYAADRIDPNGATSITVHLYRDWGRPTEKEESFVIELNKDHEGTVDVGSFKRN